MISLFGYSLTALAPWALLALPAALGLLVYVYRKRGETNSTVVSALFLFEKLPRVLPSRRKFVPPFRFWLELLAFLLLALAAAGIVANRGGKHIAIAVDTSMSMAARDPSGLPRIESAKSSALGDLASSGVADRFSVFSIGSTLNRISEAAVGTTEVRDALENLSAVHTVDRVGTLVTSLLGDTTYDEVWLYTDRQPASRSESDPRLRFVTLTTAAISTSLTNAWIEELKGGESDGRPAINALVGVTGQSNLSVLLTAHCYREDGAELPASTAISTVSPGAPVSIPIPLRSPEWSECSVTAGLEDGISDVLSYDNAGYLARGSHGRSVALVGPLSPDQLGFKAITTVSVEKSSPQDTAADTRAIFHRTVPNRVRSAATLVVYPPAGPLPWGGSVKESAIEAGKITRILESSPLTLYVNSALLSLPKPRIIECPETSAPIMYTSEGAIACAGESRGGRYVILGFEIFPFDGAKNPSTSILTLNTLKWLFQTAGGASGARTFESIVPPDDSTSARYKIPTSLELSTTTSGAVTPPTPGIVHFYNSANKKIAALAVNFFSGQESNLSYEVPVELPMGRNDTRPSKERNLPLYHWLALLALATLSIDLLARFFERRARRRS